MSVVDDGMRVFYDRRAAEYDDWWLGSGLFERRERPGWAAEVTQLLDALSVMPAAKTLDAACGTGFLTMHLQGEVVGLDQSREMLEIAASRMLGAVLVVSDAVPLPFPNGSYHRVFTSHFYGHLMLDERQRFLEECSRFASELVVVDSARRDGVEPEEWQTRTLNDGSIHRVYKRFFTAESLLDELGGGKMFYRGDWFLAVSTQMS